MSKYVYEYALSRKKVLSVAECPRASGPEDVARLARDLGLHLYDQERLVVFILDSKNNLTATYTVTVGLLDRSLAGAREVFRIAIEKTAARIVLVHNHPSGDPTPSGADTRCTLKLAKAGQIIGIEVVDHVIIADRPPADGPGHFSFRESRMLPPKEDPVT